MPIHAGSSVIIQSDRLNEEGHSRLRGGRYKDAIASFDAALAIKPGDKTALRGKIIALRNSSAYAECDNLINAALVLYPQNPTFLVERGWLSFDRHDDREAITGFDRTLDVDEMDEGALQGKAAAIRRLGDFAKASLVLDEALLKHPESAGLLAERAWLWLDQADYPNAAAALDAALGVNQPDDSLYLWLIFVLRKLGKLDEADAVMDRANAMYPNSRRLAIEAGWLMFYRRDYLLAAEHFHQLVASAPTLAAALQGRIASLRLAGALDEAENDLRDHASMVSLDKGLLGERAWTAFAREDYEAAGRTFREIVVAHNGDHLDRVNLAWALARTGGDSDLRQAAQLCRQSLSARRSAEALGCLGVICFKTGRITDSEFYLRSSIEVDPQLGHHGDLAALHLYLLNYDEAQKVLAEGLELKSGDPRLHIEYAALERLRDQPDRAINCYRRALRLDPQNLETLLGLGSLLLEAGRADEAEVVVRKGLSQARDGKRSGPLLLFARVLSAQFDDRQDKDLLAGALRAIGECQRVRRGCAETYFLQGVVLSKLRRNPEALSAFVACQKLDETWLDAAANASQLKLVLNENRPSLRFSELKSWALFLVVLCQLAVLWAAHIEAPTLVGETAITVLVPICLGLMIVAFLLPSLTKFSVTGIAIELKQPPSMPDQKGPIGELQSLANMPVVGPAL